MSAGELTIAWTAGEAVLLGPDSRVIRQPLHPDDDPPAVILEAWRMEFPEAPAARLLIGDPSIGPAAARLAALAAEAGLRLDGAAATPGSPRPWRIFVPRPLTRRARRLLGAALALALGAAGWEWTSTRQSARRREATDAERSAELAADGRRRQETAEQRAAIAAACAVPEQFQGEFLHRLAGASAAVVLESLEIDGADCLLRGQLVPAAPGAEGAVDVLRRSLFAPADRWQSDAGRPAGPNFALHATLLPPPAAERSRPLLNPADPRARFPSRSQLAAWQKTWSQAWIVSAAGSEVRAGVELQRFDLQGLNHSDRAWRDVLYWLEQWHQQPGVAVDRIGLSGVAAHTGAFERVQVTLTARARVE